MFLVLNYNISLKGASRR